LLKIGVALHPLVFAFSADDRQAKTSVNVSSAVFREKLATRLCRKVEQRSCARIPGVFPTFFSIGSTDMSTQWFCRIMGEEWGPMSALELYAVARRGRLTRDDVVRNGFNGDWVRAETICGLFDGSVSTTISRRISVSARHGQLPRPASRTMQIPPERYWVRHEAEMAGPFSGRQIRRLAAMGKLKPEYLVSSDRNQWQPVADFKARVLACG
jgi:hypothetical protein